jgi:hypothetical protein
MKKNATCIASFDKLKISFKVQKNFKYLRRVGEGDEAVGVISLGGGIPQFGFFLLDLLEISYKIGERSIYNLDEGISVFSDGWCKDPNFYYMQIEFGGRFFLKHNALEKLTRILAIIEKETKHVPNATVAHLAFTGPFSKTATTHHWINRFKRNSDFKKLLIKEVSNQKGGSKQKEVESLYASNQNSFELVVYDKEKELKKKVPKKNSENHKKYVRQFEEKYRCLGENLIRIEIRVENTLSLNDFSILLVQGKFQEAMRELYRQSRKRVSLPKVVLKKLEQSL